MPDLIDEPEDPGPRAPFEERERYLRDMERWATEGGRISDEPGDLSRRNLQRLERRHQRFLDIHSPVKASVWLALLRPVEELFARANDSTVSGIVALGEAIARKAIATGDVSAFNAIADRIEGRVGIRKGDVDPEAEARAEQTVSLIERVVETLTEAKLEGRFETIDGEVTDITPVPAPERARREPPVEREVEREVDPDPTTG